MNDGSDDHEDCGCDPESLLEHETSGIFIKATALSILKVVAFAPLAAIARFTLAVLGAFALHWSIGVAILVFGVGRMVWVFVVSARLVLRYQREGATPELVSHSAASPTEQVATMRRKMRSFRESMPKSVPRMLWLSAQSVLGGWFIVCVTGWPSVGVASMFVLWLSPWWSARWITEPSSRAMGRLVLFADPTRMRDTPEC